MPADQNDRQDFFKGVQARKVQKAEKAREIHAFRKPAPVASEVELKRLRKEHAELQAKVNKIRASTANMLSRANRMSQIPTHVVKDFANDVLRTIEKG